MLLSSQFDVCIMFSWYGGLHVVTACNDCVQLTSAIGKSKQMTVFYKCGLLTGMYMH